MKTISILLLLLFRPLLADEKFPVLSELIDRADAVVAGEVTFLMGEVSKDHTFDYAIQFRVLAVYKGVDLNLGKIISLNYEGITDSDGNAFNGPQKGRTIIFFLRKEVLRDPFEPENPLTKWHPVDRLFGVIPNKDDRVEKEIQRIIK